MKSRILLPLIPAVASLAFAAPAIAAGSSEAVSENWAGYEAQMTDGDGFTAVSGSWVQPKASCTTGSATYSAYWVGLGGGSENSDALEQEGTQSDCTAGGAARYYAWYELVPKAPVKLSLAVAPGDQMYARTTVEGSTVTMYVANRTTGQSVAKTLTDSQPDTSTAEWVAEAPSQCDSSMNDCETLPLTDFGSVHFTDAHATSDGHTGTVSDSRWQTEAIALQPSDSGAFYGAGPGGYGAYGSSGFGPGGGAESQDTSDSSEGAAPTGLSSGGSSFTVTYGASPASGATSGGSSTSTGGYGEGGSGYGGSGYGGSGYGGSGYGGSGYGGSGGYGSGDYGAGGYGYGSGDYGSGGYSSGSYGDGGYSYGAAGYGGGDGGYGYGGYASGGYGLFGEYGSVAGLIPTGL